MHGRGRRSEGLETPGLKPRPEGWAGQGLGRRRWALPHRRFSPRSTPCQDTTAGGWPRPEWSPGTTGHLQGCCVEEALPDTMRPSVRRRWPLPGANHPGTAPRWGRLRAPRAPWSPKRTARHPTSQASSLKPTLLCTDAATSVCVSGGAGGGAGAALLREESICQASLVPESRALPPPRATAGCAGRSTAPCHSGDIWDSHRRRKQPPPRRLQHSPGQEERLPAGGPKPLPRPLHSIYNHHRFLKIPNIKK